MAHIGQSGPDSGLDLQVKVLEAFQVVPFSLGSGFLGGVWESFADGPGAVGGSEKERERETKRERERERKRERESEKERERERQREKQRGFHSEKYREFDNRVYPHWVADSPSPPRQTLACSSECV